MLASERPRHPALGDFLRSRPRHGRASHIARRCTAGLPQAKLECSLAAAPSTPAAAAKHEPAPACRRVPSHLADPSRLDPDVTDPSRKHPLGLPPAPSATRPRRPPPRTRSPARDCRRGRRLASASSFPPYGTPRPTPLADRGNGRESALGRSRPDARPQPLSALMKVTPRPS